MSDDSGGRHLNTDDGKQTNKELYSFLPPRFFIESIGRCVVKNEGTAEQQQQAIDESVKNYTFWLAIIAVFSLVASVASCKAVRNQVFIMETDERPWVSAPSAEGIGCLVKEDASPALTLKNVGKTVAKNLFVTVDFGEAGSTSIAARASEACEAAMPKYLDNPYVVIPSDVFRGGVFFSRNSAGTIRIEEIATLAEKMSNPVIVGCAVYGSGFDVKPHRTMFYAPILRAGPRLCVRDIYNLKSD